MLTCTNVVLFLVILYFITLFMTLYTVSNPPTCKASDSFCIYPLLNDDDFVYISIRALNKDVLWDHTSRLKDLYVESVVTIPLPGELRSTVYHPNPKNYNVIVQVAKVNYIEGTVDINHVNSYSFKVPLTAVRKRRVVPQNKNLVSPSSTQAPPPTSQADTCLHWNFGIHPLVVRVAAIGQPLRSPYLPSLQLQLNLQPSSDRRVFYSPIVYIDNVSLTRNHYLELSSNQSAAFPKIKLKFETMSLLHFAAKQGIAQVINSLNNFLPAEEIDELRYWLSDDRIYRYALTQFITFVHIFFEYLAFKDDLKFFSGRKSFSGVSLSSLLFAQLRGIVIFLYLYDSDTSTLILFSVGKDVVYNLWKVSRIMNMNIAFTKRTGDWISVPVVSYTERRFALSEEDRRTAEYDSYAITHMCLCLYPAIIGVAIYSLTQFAYKSWWSWFISSMADSVYFFGFISMCPQLYINYKLKSVAHLPLKAFAYKMFNTFVDDLFAFLVKMPLKHRIMTLRDDVVFLGFVYQWWVYPPDPTRPNEFGYTYEEEKELTRDALQIEVPSVLSVDDISPADDAIGNKKE